MKSLILRTLLSFLMVLTTSVAAGRDMGEVVRESTCGPQMSSAPVLYNEDFDWGQSLAEIEAREARLYASEKRLQDRAYVNPQGRIVLPIKVYPNGPEEIILTERFIKSIRTHIEKALERNYVDAIIFSDMGHSHYFIPKKYYDKVLNPIPSEKRHIMYQKMLAYPDLKILYHTAEQLQMLDENKELLDDRHIQWRFFTRNLVGDNRAQGNLEFLHNEGHSYNTARSYGNSHKYWGAGFYLSANKNGCFPFVHKGETYYFDINLIGFKPASGGGGYL